MRKSIDKEFIEKEMKKTVDLVIWQRNIRDQMYLQAFHETIGDTIKRRFKGKPVIL